MNQVGDGVSKEFAKEVFEHIYKIAEDYGFKVKTFRMDKENNVYLVKCRKSGKVPYLRFILAYKMMFFQGEIFEIDTNNLNVILK